MATMPSRGRGDVGERAVAPTPAARPSSSAAASAVTSDALDRVTVAVRRATGAPRPATRPTSVSACARIARTRPCPLGRPVRIGVGDIEQPIGAPTVAAQEQLVGGPARQLDPAVPVAGRQRHDEVLGVVDDVVCLPATRHQRAHRQDRVGEDAEVAARPRRLAQPHQRGPAARRVAGRRSAPSPPAGWAARPSRPTGSPADVEVALGHAPGADVVGVVEQPADRRRHRPVAVVAQSSSESPPRSSCSA